VDRRLQDRPRRRARPAAALPALRTLFAPQLEPTPGSCATCTAATQSSAPVFTIRACCSSIGGDLGEQAASNRRLPVRSIASAPAHCWPAQSPASAVVKDQLPVLKPVLEAEIAARSPIDSGIRASARSACSPCRSRLVPPVRTTNSVPASRHGNSSRKTARPAETEPEPDPSPCQ